MQITADETNDFAACTAPPAPVPVAFGAGDEFVAFRGTGDFLGRLSFDGGPDPSVELPGATLTIAASSSGPPTVRGSELFVPVDSHVSPVLLPLSDPPTSIVLGGGGFGSGGNLPTVIVGGEMTVPKPSGTQGELIKTRRMQIGTASTDDLTGLNAMFSCDEAESVALFCDKFE